MKNKPRHWSTHPVNPRYLVTCGQVFAATCDHLHVSFAQLEGPSRKWPIHRARVLAIYLAYRWSTLPVSLERIGRLLNRTHGTISVAIRTAEDLISTDAKFLIDLKVVEELSRGRL